MRDLSLVLLAILTVTPALRAHDTWLAPDRLRAGTSSRTTLSLSSGMEFPALDHAIAADRVASAIWRTARASGMLPPGTSTAHALTFRAAAPKGLSVYAVTLHPRSSSLKRAQVREYIDHLGIPDAASAFSAWEQRAAVEETPYRYVKYAKTIVRRGADASRVWAQPVGMRLEIVPQSDPTAVTAGSTIEVLVLDGGKPLARYPVSMLRAGAAEPITAATGADGRARFTLFAAGQHMIRATKLEPSADRASVWDVHFTTFTFEVARGQ